MNLRRSNYLLLFTYFFIIRQYSTKYDKSFCYLDTGDDMENDIYTLAHEIRNPLSVVKGYLEMLNEENLYKYREIIQNEVSDSLNILNDYLEYNRICLNKEEIDLNMLLQDLKDSFKDYLKNNNTYLHIETIDNEIYLKADYNKLKQVFKNIIKNSIESKSKNIYINYRIMFGKVVICIKNDGIKIDKDTMVNIGNFYTNKTNGNGIGTSLIKKIINLHHGKIKYKNNNGKGVSIFITLSLS